MVKIKEILLKTLESLGMEDMKKFQWYLRDGIKGYAPIPWAHLENAERHTTVDKMVEMFGHNKAVEVTLDVLKKLHQNQLAKELETNYEESIWWSNLKAKEKRYFIHKFAKRPDKTSLEEDALSLQDVYTELYVTESCTGGVNTEHEIKQIEAFYPKLKDSPVKLSDVFQVQSGQNVPGTKVLTLGIAGVGKTASVQKFILDWAGDKSNQDIDFILYLPFRDLNVIKDNKYNLLSLVKYLHRDFNDEDVKEMLRENGRMIFIFDGLDESQIHLEFNQEKVSEVTEENTLDKLIINLIKGELLPSALIWITSRPAAADKIPHKYIDQVTEIRGFNDSQKQEYFKKRLRDPEKAHKVITYIRSVRSLHILCHIPIFCKISAKVLLKMLDDTDMENAPTTLTEMYTRFLVFQTKQKSEKYSTISRKDSTVQLVDRDTLRESDILKLGKLAFLQLQREQVTFYKNDLEECDIDVDGALVQSGVCTQIFEMDETHFSFVHLSFQEFLAAVFVFFTFVNGAQSPYLQTLKKMQWKIKHKLVDNLKTALKKAMESENGHLDLFLRFLIGLSLQSNQRLLKSLLPELTIKEESLEDTIKYIQSKIKETTSSEKVINLFHCLSELKDTSLTSDIQKYLISDEITTQKLSSTQWSALAFVLRMSEETQEKFELKKYRPSNEALRRLLPVVKTTQRALLDNSNLNENSCKALATVFSSMIKELDLSNNDLQDSGVKQLCVGLKSSHCKLEILRLSGCMITEEGCSSLDSALSSNPSHLKELDLTYNHPGDSGVKLLTAKLKDTQYRLETLRMEFAGENRIKPGLRKYACEIRLDPNTAHRQLSLSEGNRKVVYTGEEQPYPNHPKRFDDCEQVLSTEALSGRCYWEAEWSDEAEIAVTYKGIVRQGDAAESQFGWNEKSWSLIFCNDEYSVLHNKEKIILTGPPFRSNRAGVYLDWPASTLSFYSVSSGARHATSFHLLHTYHETFTEPLYAGFRVNNDCSLHLCKI
ncbi:NACHT, LRR and PYD domains-containing protein 6-like [Salminus brasiliensis]|uniref:NACHT, LRR and PYD domains-containing protein 6-like n=1 Tax=Salminus brasiliensis TaxID=930266 RepID=UPI003B835A4B